MFVLVYEIMRICDRDVSCACSPSSLDAYVFTHSSVEDQTAEWKAPAAPRLSEQPAAVLHQHPGTLLPL